MREIKFRAWDTNPLPPDKQMLNVDDMTEKEFKNNGVYLYQNLNILIYTNNDRYKLMQYTGLKDKNGVEIYEGDIIKSTDFDAYEVKWIVYIGEENFGDGIGYTGWNIELNCGYPPVKQELEVIGNIYENQELLEDK